MKTTMPNPWCAVFTAWPVSTTEGRKPRGEPSETARAFTWSDQSAYGASQAARRFARVVFDDERSER